MKSRNLPLSALWTGSVFLISITLLFLPPAVMSFRNPPPPDLVMNWWGRFSLSLVAASLNLFTLFGPITVPGWRRGVHYFMFLVAMVIATMLFQWPVAFPYPFNHSLNH